jgi:hypothetical protein
LTWHRVLGRTESRMAFRHHELSTLVRHQPRVAVRRIVEAYEHVGCRVDLTADRLGVTTRTFARWVDQLGIGLKLRELRAEVRKRRVAA